MKKPPKIMSEIWSIAYIDEYGHYYMVWMTPGWHHYYNIQKFPSPGIYSACRGYALPLWCNGFLSSLKLFVHQNTTKKTIPWRMFYCGSEQKRHCFWNEALLLKQIVILVKWPWLITEIFIVSFSIDWCTNHSPCFPVCWLYRDEL